MTLSNLQKKWTSLQRMHWRSV